MAGSNRTLAAHLASLVGAFHRCCEPTANDSQRKWANRHEEDIKRFVKNYMPSGSGIDNGTTIDLDKSNENKLIFYTAFHHMNDVGYYTGWTDHTVIVTPAFNGFHIKITGKDRNDIKDYLYETFDMALKEQADWYNR